MAMASIKKREEISLEYEILYSKPPKEFFIPHHLYRNPQETAKSISFEIGPAYTQNRCSSHPAHMVNFIWPLEVGKKKDNRYFLRCESFKNQE